MRKKIKTKKVKTSEECNKQQLKIIDNNNIIIIIMNNNNNDKNNNNDYHDSNRKGKALKGQLKRH